MDASQAGALATMALAAASFTTLAFVLNKRAAGQPLLPYEPRRPVPWNFVVVVLALTPALFSIADAVTTSSAASSDSAEGPLPADLWAFAGALITLTVVCYAVLAAAFQATPRDLGLPLSASELRRDVAAGAVAYLAILLPVYSIQFMLVSLVETNEIHPILRQMETDTSGQMMLAAAMGAIIAAPLFEETAFRLVFQGWLEKHEGPVESVPGHGLEHTPADDAPSAIAIDAAPDSTMPPPPDGHDAWSDAATLPIAHYAPNRPCNWAAILVSSTIFAIAHIGQGVAPWSLFPLGMALGYLYQRTHRIVPSMVCHALFNSTSLLAVWLATRAVVD